MEPDVAELLAGVHIRLQRGDAVALAVEAVARPAAVLPVVLDLGWHLEVVGGGAELSVGAVPWTVRQTESR